MDKIRISAVRYANTYPFIFGLTELNFGLKAVIETDHPSDCAQKLIDGRADLGLIPVAVIPLIKDPYIIGDYCIGANGKVRTVQLMSNSQFNDIERIYLDYRSRTSVSLIKVLAANLWNEDFVWINTSEGFDFDHIRNKEAVVLIGDQCFEYEGDYLYRWDLAEEWKNLTGLPFVFAVWVSNRRLQEDFIDDFNNALAFGVRNIDKVVERFGSSGSIAGVDLMNYLKDNIDFVFDDKKKKAMSLFLELQLKL